MQEPVRYVVYRGVKHIVDGHHRLFAARELNLPNIPSVEVKLLLLGKEKQKTLDIFLSFKDKMSSILA